jgi:NTP pyrophosphatase (non-canonical NTP hydrolase)
MEAVRGEIADIYMSIVYLAHVLGIDPVQASSKKLEEMRLKYPADVARGKILKYSAYESK